MRRLFAAGSLLVVAMLLSACAASQSPNWTYAPPTIAPSVNPSAAASGEASAPASTAPSAEASAGASAPAASDGGGGSGATVDITAHGTDWVTKDLTAPANTALKIHFDNQDDGIPHNVIITSSQGEQELSSALLTGVAQADYDVKPLPAGTYTFTCIVHNNMKGTLTVQ